MDNDKKQSLIWLLKFWASLAFFYWLHGLRWVEDSILGPFAAVTAFAAQKVLPRIGMETEQSGTVIRAGTGVFEIAGSCTGTLVIFLFAAAVLSFPSPWKSRIKGLFLGMAGITLLNFARTLFIIVVTSKFPGTFWLLHVVIGQAVVIVGTVGIYLWWINQRGDVSFLPEGKREAAATTGLFLAGFVGGYLAYYFLFLKSPLGVWASDLIGAHSAAVLAFFFDATYHGRVLSASGTSIELAPECLSSPVVVLFTAVVVALPVKWWKKLLAAVAGFLPIYYTYHLISTVAVVLSLTGGGATSDSFVYVHIQQLVMIPALLLLVSCYDRGGGDAKKCARHLLYMLGAVVVAIPLSVGAGALYRTFFLPEVTGWISGSPEIFLAYHQPQITQVFSLNHVLRTMFDFEFCIWILLVATEPRFDRAKRMLVAAAGAPAVLLHCFAVVAAIETFKLIPNLFLMQAWIVIAPFAAFYGTKYLNRFTKNKEEKHGQLHLLQDR